jgi:hypothetical protein
VSATGPELHLDVSALQRSVLLLEVSATGPELNLDVSALGRFSCLKFTKSTLNKFFSNSDSPYKQYKESATPRITDTRSRRLPVSLDTGSRFSLPMPFNIEGVRFASKIICLLSKVFAFLQK